MLLPRYSDPIAVAIYDRVGRSRAALEHVGEIIVDLGVAIAGETDPQLVDFLVRIRAVLSHLASLWKHQPTDSFLKHAAAVEAILEAGQNGYMRLAGAAGISSIESSRRSGIALILGDALCTLRTGVPGALVVRDTTNLQGSANCASTGGGGAPSLHRNTNVVEQVVRLNQDGSGLRISNLALQHVSSLRVDPVAVPGASGVVSSLYLISRGLVTSS